MSGEIEPMMVGNGRKIVMNGKHLGTLDRNGKVFRAFKSEARHTYRMYKSFGMNLQLLKELRDIGVDVIEVRTTDTRRVFRATLADWFAFGISMSNPRDEKDYQLQLPKERMDVGFLDLRPNQLTKWVESDERRA